MFGTVDSSDCSQVPWVILFMGEALAVDGLVFAWIVSPSVVSNLSSSTNLSAQASQTGS